MQNKTRLAALMGLATAMAMILSYIEFLLPPLFSAVPGIKLGLANIVIIFIVYRLGVRYAALVSLLRVCLSSLLFGTVMTFAYSLAGAVISLAVMALLRKTKLFSVTGVSIAGGVSHNFAQVTVAAFILSTREIVYYMVPLSISGIIAGIFIGICAALLLKYIKKI